MASRRSSYQVDGSGDDAYIGGIYLEPNESRPRTVSHLAKAAAAEVKVPLAERYKTTLRDCALAGYRPSGRWAEA